MPTDLELLDAWRAGDLTAGDKLFNRHFAAIHRFFRNKIVADGLEDLVQQTFAACVEGRERFRSDSSFKTYLFGVAHNLLRDHYRAQRREPEVLDFGQSSAVDMGAGPSTVVGKRREERLLLEALRAIPLDSQIVLELYYWEEMSASQTAVVLGIPEGTVRGRVRKAKELLRKELAKLARSPQELETTVGNLERWAANLREQMAQ
ncbi:RNA polymerase sigma factor [Paraliomyxa miuraensis]|uniref:RNA polymerase sigma factor n=1 Tax=Paraliomyxa miuraensis TaxID=376150 RepID=UPI00224DCB47|nr:sigma-70 family RNA polymerase sigma factor [Paraliomyxa miuraensis]MCX4246764.1 sigma-70 family RNA polymerase sigma factor [Paraliomyxa miuraensis]